MRMITTLIALSLAPAAVAPSFSQTNPDLHTYFTEYIRLTNEQIDSIHNGKPVAKTLRSRKGDEIFVFGAVYVKAAPEAYVKLSQDFDRLRSVSGVLAVSRFSSPPRLSDFNGFSLEKEDIEALKKCKPGDCDVQLPDRYIEDFRKSVDWSSPQVAEQINKALREAGLERLVAYQHEGNRALGIYHDKQHPVDVSEQFKYMLSYSEALPRYLPDFNGYLLTYPAGKPAKTEDGFYWAKVKFGLKPTLRVVHVTTSERDTSTGPVYVIAEKQLYASHYFQTALDLTFCVSDRPAQEKGFYLIKAMGSEQAGLTGVKGSVVRKAAVSRSTSSLQNSLTAIKDALEHPQ
jgi:hypothetical protein